MRFGILGDAKIAREKLLPAILAAGHEVTHLGRREPSGGADPVWGDVCVSTYEAMLADPDIDAVYNPLPNHLHVPMAIRALEAGKPVLSEKPLALSLDELDAVEAAMASTGHYLYDGYMVRYHPQWDWLRSLDLGARTHGTRRAMTSCQAASPGVFSRTAAGTTRPSARHNPAGIPPAPLPHMNFRQGNYRS